MAGLTSIFKTNEEAAHAVSDYLAPHRFSLRPYNYHKPEFTEWWFYTPAAKRAWPAYPYSKLFVSTFKPDSDPAKHLHAGFYVEKGLGADLAMPGVKRNHLIQPNWHWHTFLDLAQKGDLDSGLSRVLAECGAPVWVSLYAYEFNKPPAVDEERPPFHDLLQFTVRSDDLALYLEQESSKTLAPLNSSLNLRDLSRRLSIHDGLKFFWIDLLIGIQLSYGDNSPGSWGAAEIWSNALEPWASWV